MASDEYFDAVGKVLSYVLSAEDFITGQENIESAKGFIIQRNNSVLRFIAPKDKRYFTIINKTKLTSNYIQTYKKNNDLFNQHMAEYDAETLHDENLEYLVACNRVSDIGNKKIEKALKNVMTFSIHSDCRIREIKSKFPEESDEDVEFWNGIRSIGLLYPYEEDFKPRDYETVAQEVISVGTQIEDSLIKDLDLGTEINAPSDLG